MKKAVLDKKARLFYSGDLCHLPGRKIINILLILQSSVML